MLAAMLTAAGYRTGLYTSPHLLRLTERMRIDGAEMPPEGLAEAVTALAVAAEGMSEKCTEFELMTAAAFWWFAHSGCEYVVLEVGMGGRLDATNVIPAPTAPSSPTSASTTPVSLATRWSRSPVKRPEYSRAGSPPVINSSPPWPLCCAPRRSARAPSCTLPTFQSSELLSDSLEGQSFRYDGHEYRIRLLGEHQTKTPPWR